METASLGDDAPLVDQTVLGMDDEFRRLGGARCSEDGARRRGAGVAVERLARGLQIVMGDDADTVAEQRLEPPRRALVFAAVAALVIDDHGLDRGQGLGFDLFEDGDEVDLLEARPQRQHPGS